MSVDIIFPELFLGKADLRRHSEKISVYIISLALYSAKTYLRRHSEKLSLQYVFHCLRLFVIKKYCCLKIF